MSALQRYANIGAVFVPFVAFLFACVVFWNDYIDAVDIGLMVFMHLITGFGITIGYHRMLTHRAFQTSKPVEYTFAALGSMAVQGPVIAWVADHRKHHAFTDQEGDPHSPHVGHGSGLKGLWYSHVGWLWTEQGRAEFRKYAPDLCEDKGMRWISRNFLMFVGLTLLIPFVLGFVLHGFELKGALTALLWAGFVRIFFLHHVTWSINSVCHFFGKRRFDVEDHSTNVAWLAIPSLGEAWHHNHHAFPRAAAQGLRRREVDISAGVIWTMEKLGLVWNVVRISPERQAKKLIGAAQAAADAVAEPEREKVPA